MKNKVEKAYGTTLKGAFKIVNPIKKRLIKTYCLVHKYINYEATKVLEKQNLNDEFNFYRKNITYLNKGVVWADQDFKSINHFFHYEKEKGLFGFSNAMLEFLKYYEKAQIYFKEKDTELSMFYLGAACHLLQDATVPQHVNNKLLKQHRNFELWIINEIVNNNSYGYVPDAIYCENLKDYIRMNAKMANETYKKYVNIEDIQERYNKVASTIVVQAKSTTAGLMIKFYKDEVRDK